MVGDTHLADGAEQMLVPVCQCSAQCVRRRSVTLSCQQFVALWCEWCCRLFEALFAGRVVRFLGQRCVLARFLGWPVTLWTAARELCVPAEASLPCGFATGCRGACILWFYSRKLSM